MIEVPHGSVLAYFLFQSGFQVLLSAVAVFFVQSTAFACKSVMLKEIRMNSLFRSLERKAPIEPIICKYRKSNSRRNALPIMC